VRLLRRRDRPAPAVAEDSTAPAHALSAVAAARAPGTKNSPLVTVAKRTWRAKKRPYKRQRKSHVPAPVPQAAAPAAAPKLVPLIAIDKAAARAPVEKKSPVLPAAPAVAPASFSLNEPIHPSIILIQIVGTQMSCQGRSCKEHKICGEVLKEDVGVHLHKMQLMVEGKEEKVIAAICVRVDRIDRFHIGFVPRQRQMVKQVARYDGVLT